MRLRVDTLRIGTGRNGQGSLGESHNEEGPEQNNAAKFLAFTKILALERIQILQLIGCANNIQIGRE